MRQRASTNTEFITILGFITEKLQNQSKAHSATTVVMSPAISPSHHTLRGRDSATRIHHALLRDGQRAPLTLLSPPLCFIPLSPFSSLLSVPSGLLLHHSSSTLLLFLPLLHPRLDRLDAIFPPSPSPFLLLRGSINIEVVVKLGLLTQEWCRVGEILGRQELDYFLGRWWDEASMGDVACLETLFVGRGALCGAS